QDRELRIRVVRPPRVEPPLVPPGRQRRDVLQVRRKFTDGLGDLLFRRRPGARLEFRARQRDRAAFFLRLFAGHERPFAVLSGQALFKVRRFPVGLGDGRQARRQRHPQNGKQAFLVVRGQGREVVVPTAVGVLSGYQTKGERANQRSILRLSQ